MKSVVTLAVAAVLACACSAAFAQSKSIKEQNDYAKSVQRANEAKRVQNNNSVNQVSQQQRYNATRPYTPPAKSSYTPPPKTYTPPPPTSTYKRK